MSLGDIMSNAGLSSWAEVALVIFFVAFLGIVIYVFTRKRGKWNHEADLPLEDGETTANLEGKKR